MTLPNRWLTAGLLTLAVPALVWAAANEPAGSSPPASDVKTPDAKSDAPSKPAKPPKRISGFTEEREAAAMTFVRMNHPELAALLDQLKLNDAGEYQRAIRDLFRSSEKLAQLQERNPQRYAMELEAWKLNSRIRLLVARLTMSPDPKIEDELRAALVQQIGLRKESIRAERERLENRVAELKEQLDKLSQEQDAAVEKRMAKLLSEASRSHSELKAAHEGGSKKKKSEKRGETETSAPPKSKE
jgi:hypothetical protein